MVTNSVHWRSAALLEAVCLNFGQLFDGLRAAHARRQTYLNTAFELGRLSDRTLKDLGISRCEINHLAREASHDRN